MRFVIAGGGTGGHLFPGLAVAEIMQEKGKRSAHLHLRERGRCARDKATAASSALKNCRRSACRVSFAGHHRILEKIHTEPRALPRDLQEIPTPRRAWMGGFTSTAPILAGRSSQRFPRFCTSRTRFPARRIASTRSWSTWCSSASSNAPVFSQRRCEVTGTPIRRKLMQNREGEGAGGVRFSGRPENPARDGRQPGRARPQRGDDQGHAAAEGSAAAGAPPHRRARRATGGCELPEGEHPSFVAAFHHRMEEAYSAADCAIARSGAASLAELSHFGIPSILIPYPWAAENHQALNAEIFDCAGAAAVLMQSETTGEKLAEKVRGFLGDPARLQAMSGTQPSTVAGDAARRVVGIIEKNCNDGYWGNPRGHSGRR